MNQQITLQCCDNVNYATKGHIYPFIHMTFLDILQLQNNHLYNLTYI